MTDEKVIFDCMRIPERTSKPRSTGLTMVEGDYMLAVAGMHWLEDLVQWGGQWIDYFKVGHPMMFQPKDLVLRKLALLRQHNLKPYIGGNTTEAVIAQGCVDPFLDELQVLGIEVMEVSSTVLPLTLEQKVQLIRKGRAKGLTFFAEVGKKLIGTGGPNERMATGDVVREMRECLSAGAFKVVYEHTEIEELVHKGTGFEPLLDIAREVGTDNIMFEVPIAQWKEVSMYARTYLKHFGSNVSIGDVDPIHVLMLESMRTGLTHKTFDIIKAPQA